MRIVFQENSFWMQPDVFDNTCLSDAEDNGMAFLFHMDAYLVVLQLNERNAEAQQDFASNETRRSPVPSCEDI